MLLVASLFIRSCNNCFLAAKEGNHGLKHPVEHRATAMSPTNKSFQKLQHVTLICKESSTLRLNNRSSRLKAGGELFAHWYMWHLSLWGYHCQCKRASASPNNARSWLPRAVSLCVHKKKLSGACKVLNESAHVWGRKDGGSASEISFSGVLRVP